MHLNHRRISSICNVILCNKYINYFKRQNIILHQVKGMKHAELTCLIHDRMKDTHRSSNNSLEGAELSNKANSLLYRCKCIFVLMYLSKMLVFEHYRNKFIKTGKSFSSC